MKHKFTSFLAAILLIIPQAMTANSAPISGDDCFWRTVGRDVEHQGYAPNYCGPKSNNIGEIWSFDVGLSALVPPSIFEDYVYFTGQDKRLHKLEAETGKEVASMETGAETRSQPFIEYNRIFFGSQDHNLYCVDENLDKVWKTGVLGGIISAPLVYGGRVYVGSLGGKMYGISAATGNIDWECNIRDAIDTSPAFYLGKVYVGTRDHFIYALDCETGKVFWKFETGGSIYSSPMIMDGRLYIGSDDKYIYCLDAETGELKWRYNCGNIVRTNPCGFEDKVFISSGDTLFCLSADYGKPLWQYTDKNHQVSSASLCGGKIYFGSGNYVVTLEMDTGERLSAFETKGSVGAVSICSQKVFAPSLDGKLYCLGDTQNEISVSPSELNFGEVVLDSPQTMKISLANNTDRQILVKINPQAKWLVVDNDIFELDPGASTEINAQINWKQEIKKGQIRGIVHVSWGSFQYIITCRAYILTEVGSKTVDCGNSQFKANPGKTGFVDESCGPATNKVAKIWSAKFENQLGQSPVVTGKRIFVGPSFGKRFYCLDLDTGKILWDVQTSDYISTTAAVAYEKVLFACRKTFVCLNSLTGESVWSIDLQADINSSPLVYDDRVVFGCNDKNVYCYNIVTGKQIWKFKANSPVESSPAAGYGKVYFGSQDGSFYAVSQENGKQAWILKTPKEIVSSPTVQESKVYFGGKDNKVYCVDTTNGKIIWTKETKGSILSSAATDGNVVVIGSNDHALYCLNAMTGDQIWRYPTGSYITNSPVIFGGKVVAGSNDKQVYCLDVVSGEKLWSYKTGDSIKSSPIVFNGCVYVGSYDKFLYCLSDSFQQLDASPDLLDFGEVVPEELGKNPKPLILTVSNMVEEKLDVTFTLESDVFKVSDPSYTIEPGKDFLLTVTVNEKMQGEPGIYWSTLKVASGAFEKTVLLRVYIKGSSETSQSTSGCEWVCFKRNPQRNGFEIDGCGPATNALINLWTTKLPAPIESSPVTFNNKLFVGCLDGKLYCLDIKTGTMLWNFETKGPIYSSPSVTEAKVVIGSNDGYVYCLDTEDGKLLWDFQTDAAIQSSPTITTDYGNTKTFVFVTSLDGKIYALDLLSGQSMWQFNARNPIYSSPSVNYKLGGGKFTKMDSVFFGTIEGDFFCLDASSGMRKWSYRFPAPCRSTPAAMTDKVFVGCHDGYTYCFETKAGNVLWSFKTGVVNSPSLFAGYVYCASNDTSLYCLAQKDGKLIWNYKTGSSIYSSPAISGGKVYFGGLDGKMYTIDAGAPEKLFTFSTKDQIVSSVAISMGMVFVCSKDQNIYCLADVFREISFDPKNIDFGSNDSKTARTIDIEIQNNYKDGLKVKIETIGDWFKLYKRVSKADGTFDFVSLPEDGILDIKYGDKYYLGAKLDPAGDKESGPKNGLIRISWLDREALVPVIAYIKE